VKSFASHTGPLGNGDLCFCSPEADASLCCGTTDMGQCIMWCACLCFYIGNNSYRLV